MSHKDDPEPPDPALALELRRLKRALGLLPGREWIGRYRLIEQIGKGGMGIVFAAEDPGLERRVALKLVRPRRPGSRERLELRLQREARALGRLNHENVVRVYDVGSDGDEVFIAMELVDGPSLLEWQRQAERGLDELLEVYAKAAAGLAAAHHAGLVHRDFKPENVFVTRTGRVLVGDFGLADLDDAPLEPGAVLGTFGYMAPEQLRGAEVDARADQFGFCVALWEAITGARPFVGDDVEAMREAITSGEPRRADAVPRRLRGVLRRGLAADPDRRFADMRELIVAIAASRRRPPWVVALILALVLASLVALAAWLGCRAATPDPGEARGYAVLKAEGDGRLGSRAARALARR